MKVLHVGCMPFPTYQGTQAAVGAMVAASAELGIDAHLVTYAGRAYDLDPPYRLHRLPDRPRVASLRSGPSFGKIALDAKMIGAIRELCAREMPDAVIAHHIEAGAAAVFAGVNPVVYVAHTRLAAELPSYLAKPWRRPAAGAASRLERFVRRHVTATTAVAPALAAELDGASYLPVPWKPETGTGPPAGDARSALGIDREAVVGLYAGNLDRYQGWEDTVAALPLLLQRHREAVLVVATESDPRPVWERAREHGVVSALRVARLDGEMARRRAHAAADFAWIPRRTPGGLPIKMLDALARGVPVVVSDRATAGLPVRDACVCVDDDHPEALARGAEHLLRDGGRRNAMVAAGRRYLIDHHGLAAFSDALEELTGIRAKRVQRPASTWVARRAE